MRHSSSSFSCRTAGITKRLRLFPISHLVLVYSCSLNSNGETAIRWLVPSHAPPPDRYRRNFAVIVAVVSGREFGKVSSRSHTVFTVTVVQKDPYADETTTGSLVSNVQLFFV